MGNASKIELLATGPKYNWWLGVTVVLGVMAIVAVVILIGYWGLLSRPESAERGDSLKALLALVGVVFTATAALVGVLLRLSIENRSAAIREAAESRRVIEAERTDVMAKQEQRRLRADTALKAVEMLGEDRSVQERGGALLALCNIDAEQVPLAVALLTDLWPVGHVTAAVGLKVVEYGLDHSSPDIQRDAATALYDNAKTLVTENGALEWPRQFTDHWDLDVHPDARRAVLLAVLQTWIDHRIADASSRKGYVNLHILMLHKGLQHEPELVIRNSIAFALNTGLTVLYPQINEKDTLGDVRLVDIVDGLNIQLSDVRRTSVGNASKMVVELIKIIDPKWEAHLRTGVDVGQEHV